MVEKQRIFVKFAKPLVSCCQICYIEDRKGTTVHKMG